MRENKFQAGVIKDIKTRLPDAMVEKLDSSYRQGIPDLLILNGAKWGVLECKADEDAPFQPNQEYYIAKMNVMSFAAVIHPSNKQDVLRDLFESLA